MTKKRNRLIAVGIALLLIIAAAVFIFPAISANAEAWDGTTATSFASGTGTETDPFQISNGAELARLAQEVNAGNYTNAYFKLTDDIDLGGVEWTPIGSTGGAFSGKFSGDGHTISNLKPINNLEDVVGLFAYNSGTIKNVYLDKVNVAFASGKGAALCAVNNYGGTIEGCAVLGGNFDVSNERYAAAICHDNHGKIDKCYNMANVTAPSCAGIVYYNYADGTVSNCYNAGKVSGIDSKGEIGGICARNYGKIEYCLNYGEVKAGQYYGGICATNYFGQSETGETSTIKSCYSDSDVCSADAIGKDWNNSTTSDVGTMTTEQLCDVGFIVNNTGFDDNVWEGGIYEGRNESSLQSRFGKIDIKYPTLKGVSKDDKSEEYEAYNFKTDGADNDWQRYTLIENKEQFLAIGRDETKWNENYVLGTDLYLMGEEVTPIGDTQAFTGKFSGDGHTITGVNVNVTNQYYPAGLFGYSTGVIMNLAVEGEIIGTNTVGGICGGNSAADDNGIIYACSFKGIVAGTGSNIGGICGYNFMGNSKISNCFSAAYVTGYNEVGGICGYNEPNATVSNTISVCTVSGSGNLVAAVCGKNDGNLTNNYFDSTVSGIYVGAKDGNNQVLSGGTTGKTTEELCGIISGFNGEVWNNGGKSPKVDENNERKRTVTYTYPRLKDVAGSAYSTEVKEYNFSTNNYENWKTYTEISTAKEFIAIGNDESKWSGNYVLTADIDLSGKTVTPIGKDYGSAFTGNFSGDGHTISGVNISSNDDNVGLFGFAGDYSGDRTTIMNLAVVGNIKGKNFVGGICGNGNNYVNIFACTFAGSVSGGSCVGGIFGEINTSCHIDNCFNSGTVSGESNVGGLLGYVSNVGNVNYNINVGKVSGATSNNPICGAVSNTLNAEYNYYNSDIFSGTDSYGTPKTTAELCADEPFGADKLFLNTTIWQAGGITSVADPDYPTNARMRVANTNYPSIIGVGEPLSLGEVKQYNFKTDGADDWQEYTEITSAADLAKIKDNLGGNYVLMKDNITLGDFTPIGSQDAPFTGKFSGNGHKISVSINTTAEYASIFGCNGGTIMNLAVEGNITGGDNVGSICGYNNGMIYACSFNGSVKGAEYVGGISGYNSSTGTITNCYAIGSVEATVDYAGGITSVNDGGQKINCCYFAGTAVAPNDYNTICNGASPNCYYDRELYNINNYGNDALTTAELCTGKNNSDLPYKFSGEIWETGSFTATSPDGKFRTVSYKYPRLKEGCAAYAVNDVKQYNFGMDGNDNWAQFNEINSLDDLNNINKNHHTNYVLMTDIDLKKGTFSPISPNKSFWGNFSGDGHTIKNGTIGSGGDFTALFSNNNGLIMNLAVKCNVSGADLVGGISGYNYGIIYGCSFEGSVKGNERVGGICGQMSGSYSHIINCYVIGSIEAATEAGGIVGASSASSSVYDTPNIENCYFVGTVTVPDSGKKDAICSNQTDIIKNCYYNKDIYTGSTTNGEGKTTAELCGGSLLNGFNDSVWATGKNDITIDPNNQRMRVQEIVYPSLKNVGEPYSLGKVKQYNFGIDSEDWQEYTEIKNAAEFIALGNDKSKWGGNYVLTADIDLKNQPVKPIGNGVMAAFTGKFSGDGHTISNVKISGENYVGLFGFCKDDAKIMNLAVANGDISGTGFNVGGICGSLFSVTKVGSITNCSFEGSVKGVSYVGGISGTNSGIITNCYAIGSVEATEEYAGGICGAYDPSTSGDKGKISNCYFAGTVICPDVSHIDAICGADKSNGVGITNCYYNKDLYKADSTKGTGKTTLEMTSSSALFEMSGFNNGVWWKTDNEAVDSKGQNGIAYYPALSGSNYVPSVKFTASLTFERTGTEPLTFLDEFEVKYGGEITFANGVTVDLNDTNCGLSAVDDSNNPISLTASQFKTTVTKAGNNTYTFTCKPKASLGGFMPNEGLTKSFAINAAKYTLKAEDFEVKALVQGYNGKAGSATVEVINTALKQSGGYGDITLRYFDSDGKEVVPINAGQYTVKIDVTEGTNCKAATALTSPSWNQLEITAGSPNPTDYKFSVSKGTTTYTLSVVELPDDLGKINIFEMTHQYGNNGVITAAERKGKNIIFTLDGSKGAGYEETVKIYIDSQNYTPFGFNVTVNVNGKGTQNAPNCEVTLTHDGNGADTYTATITAVEGAQYSFDGKDWSDTKNFRTGINHGDIVNASIRMAETDDKNASENVTKTLTAGADLVWKSDNDGHWQECSKCDYEETSHSAHIFIGNNCAVCGFKKPGTSSGGSSSGGGGSSSGGGGYSGGGSSGGGSSRPKNPVVDGKEMTWNDVTSEINKLTEGGEATIDLNGNTTVPKDVIKAIADKKALVTINVNSTFSWTIDGSKLTESDITDMDFKVSVMTASGTETLRGTVGTGFNIDNVTDKAVLNIAFKSAHSGKFANLFKKVDGKLVFADNVKIDENGNAIGLEVYEKGEYAVMLGDLSDRPGDMDNDGILNAKDALAVLKDFARLISGKNPLVCDINGDGYINANDALIILKMAAGLIKI